MLPTALKPLAAWPQFVAWRVEMRSDEHGVEHPTKVPYSPIHGYGASTKKPAGWGTYDQARVFAEKNGMPGVGFVFTEGDPFFFLDIDKALVGGQWSLLSQELCARFPGAAVEVSQSGTGLHVIGSYSHIAPHRKKNIPLGIELYTRWRFVALTGSGAVGSVLSIHDEALNAVIKQYFDPSVSETEILDWSTEPVEEWRGPEDDETLIHKALRSQSAAGAFGAAVSFADLWNCETDVLAKRWPPQKPGQDFDHSAADLSLANMLAFWTGRNCERMERIMRQSGLARSKWDDRPQWLEDTIARAAGLVKTVYQASDRPSDLPPVPPPPPREVTEAAGFGVRENAGFLFHEAQLNHFRGCIYVSGPHRVLTPGGERLDQGRFDAVYGGYEFMVGPDGKKTTTSAWDAFVKSQIFTPPIANRFCFRPEIGSGGIVVQSGLRMANTYVAVETASTPGDPKPYLDLVAKQLPDPRDQAILLNYMAACVQNPGLKAQWWPVIQGVKGNAKTLHMTVMVHAIGLQYCHLPNVEKMVRNGMNFNGWVDGKLFVGLEEVYAADRRAFFEGFKTTVTNRLIPIEGKGIEETTGDNRANGMITTNHKDGVPLDDDERRYAVFFCAQQEKPHLLRDGMTQVYFADLYDWLFGRNAYAEHGADYGLRVVNNFLRTMPLAAEFDPSRLATVAPVTSSTAEAITASRGRIEQEILEAIGDEVPGFCGDWISSLKLDDLLERKRMSGSVPRNKRRDLLRSIGYDWHPALTPNGRVNNVVMPDNGKPRLFCKIGSINWHNLTTAAQVAGAYTKAQQVAAEERTAGAFKG